jgi:hypothetical protein
MRQMVKVVVGLLFLAVLVGCGSRAKKSGTVSGTITYKGQPLNNAALLLYPAADTSATPITIPVADAGNFRISDLLPGEYKVVVQGTEGSSEASSISLKNIPPEKLAEVKAKLEKMKTVATIKFPNKYKDLKTTTLTCKITGQDETMNLELTD